MYLLDTNVISELRQTKSRPAHPKLLGWVKSVPEASLYLSAITIFEIEHGALQVVRRDPIQAAMLRNWIDTQVLPAFRGHILPIDIEVALQCAALQVPVRRADSDVFIAATALVHRMTVVTRNTADFTSTGVQLLNPWEF